DAHADQRFGGQVSQDLDAVGVEGDERLALTGTHEPPPAVGAGTGESTELLPGHEMTGRGGNRSEPAPRLGFGGLVILRHRNQTYHGRAGGPTRVSRRSSDGRRGPRAGRTR